MSVSYTFEDPIGCPECETVFPNKTWVIIDNREEPQAWDRCRKDTIHYAQCPSGHAHRIQAPLLLHDSNSNRLIYSAAPLATPAQASDDLRSLLGQVWSELPGRTLDGLENRLQIVAREVLPLAMANLDPEVILTVGEIYKLLSMPFAEDEAIQRIELCEYALGLFQQVEAPMLWATFTGRMSNYLHRNPTGDHEANIEEALDLSALVMTCVKEHDEPLRLAIAKMNLGVLYRDRTVGDVGENRECAIRLFEQSLEVFRLRLFPQYRSVACMNLGGQFLKNEENTRSEDTERAIAAFEEGAKAMTAESNPETWGELHQNLGIAYYRRVKGDASANLESAIAAYDEALRVRTISAAPHNWVLTQMDRGSAFLIRVKGDRAENIERAIETYLKAAAVAEQNGYERDWARLQYDLCYAYQLRVRDTKEANIERSIEAGERALAVLTRERFPDDWGNVQQNLGNAYRELGRRGTPHYMERAIDAYSAALSVRSSEKSAVAWLMTLDNLSGAYSELATEDAVEKSEQVFQLLEKAEEYDLRRIAPRNYARFLVNLGTAYRDRQSDDPERNQMKAVEAFQMAIDLAKEHKMYDELRLAVLRLSLLRGKVGDWERAYTEILDVVAIIEPTYTAAVTQEGKEAEADSNWFLYQTLTDVCLRTSRTVEAFLSLEKGASRVLRDELAGLPIPWPAGPSKLLETERQLLEKARQLDLSIRHAESVEIRTQLLHESEQNRESLEQTWSELANYPGGKDYISLRRTEPLSWPQMQMWLETQPVSTALVEFIQLRERWVAFVVRAGKAEPLVEELPLSPAMLETLGSTYMEGLHDDELRHPKETAEAGRQLAAGLLGPLLPHLSGVALVCLIPQGILHYVPLHALEHQGQPLLDKVAVTYATSAAVALRGSRSRMDQLATRKIFVAGNPVGDLPFAEVEATAIARRFGVTAVVGNAVSKERVLDELGQTVTAHIATHAYFDQSDPLASGILLADGHVLSAREAMAKALGVDLLVLSACSTGMQMVRMSNSLTGLARSFLYAGVKSLVISLWPVNDLSTMLLMNQFYQALEEGLGIEQSLRRAQLWLRNATADEIARWFAKERQGDERERIMSYQRASEIWRQFISLDPKVRPFKDPHHWAPFFATGQMSI